jgi:hypothetical protein
VTGAGPAEPFFHVGIIVEDLDAAMAELGRALNVTWGPAIAREVGPWRYRIAYSVEGPPHLELVEGAPDSPWARAPGLDHLGWWTADQDAELARLAEQGIAVDADLRELGSALYVRAPVTDMRLELNDASRRDGLYSSLGRPAPEKA